MKYTKVTLRLDDKIASEIAIALLGEIGFESFEENTNGINGYCQTDIFDEETMIEVLKNAPIELNFSYRIESMPDQNWNETWEQNSFKSIEIGNDCLIHSPKETPQKAYKYDIVINPKQAFGSGSHETTRLIISKLQDFDLKNKRVLDMGCGTGILSIFAAKNGAQSVTAVDIDDWSTRNTAENCELNQISCVETVLGSIERVKDCKFDLILANINRNILLEHLPSYAEMLNANGTLILSGFYTNDATILIENAEKLGLKLSTLAADNDWTILVFEK